MYWKILGLIWGFGLSLTLIYVGYRLIIKGADKLAKELYNKRGK